MHCKLRKDQKIQQCCKSTQNIMKVKQNKIEKGGKKITKQTHSVFGETIM